MVGTNLRPSFEEGKGIARVVEGSRFQEFKPSFGETLVRGFAHLF
jgi:acetyl-CoA carboxylase carboxyltransferase component